MISYFNEYVNDISEAFSKTIVATSNGEELEISDGLKLWAKKAKDIKDNTKGLMFFCGNGASATMAEHMSHDWFQNGLVNTYTVSETSHLTAISNDVSYEDVFAYRINRICSERDMLVTISSSGNSPNVVKAIATAKEKGAYVVTVSGKSPDNKSRNSGDLNFYVPLDTYGMVESAHAVLIHAALDCYLDMYMGGRH